jgi:hypothetical protein
MIRQILGSVSQFEKAMLVAKLKGARDRKIRAGIKCGGRKSYAEIDAGMVAAAKKLARYSVDKRKRTLREISAELAALGYLTRSGKPFAAAAVAKMLVT